MLGDIAPEEAYSMIVEEIEERRKHHARGRWRDSIRLTNPKVKRAAVSLLSKLSGRKVSQSGGGGSNGSPEDVEQQQPAPTPQDKSSWSPRPSPRSSPRVSRCQLDPAAAGAAGAGHGRSSTHDRFHGIIEEENSSDLAADEQEQDGVINTMGKAVSLVVKAKRLRNRTQSIVYPLDRNMNIDHHIRIREHSPTPMPPQAAAGPPLPPPPKIVFQRPSSNYLYEKRPMSHLRVPGRPPPISVPQTIFEEDVPVELLPPETPSRRRKNASNWIAPPVIDLDSDCEVKEIRVASPGVLVEQHM